MAYFKWKSLILVIILLFCSCYTATGKSVEFSTRDIKVETGRSQSVYLILNEPLDNKAEIQFTYDIGISGPSVTQRFPIIKRIPDLIVPARESGAVRLFQITALNPGHVILSLVSSSEELENGGGIEFLNEYLCWCNLHAELSFLTLPNNEIVHECKERQLCVEIDAGGGWMLLVGSPKSDSLENVFIRVDVIHSSALGVLNDAIGWIYFIAWSLSLYSQVYQNWKRKSVVGLNFDFVLYNVFGYATYSVFNVGMFWIPSIQASYLELHPRGINPVQLNDVVSSLHAVFVTMVIIIQCCIYERGSQKLSIYHGGLLLFTGLFLLVSGVLAACHFIPWLTYLYYFSYVEVAVTLIKYVPQVYMNYSKKSTEGFSIGNVFLDSTGGVFCVLQMILLAYNSEDWKSITGNLSKMGVAAFTVGFDCVFFVQHYCLYGHKTSDQTEDEETLRIITTVK